MTSPCGDPAARDDVDDLSDQLARHARLLQVIRAHMATWAPSGLDWAAFTLLMTLVKQGPRRQGELAGLALLDPSTVSRHVAQLVRAGLVERRPDPADGRALLLAVAPAGEAMAREMIRRRRELIRQALQGWDPEDVRSLARLLGRLNDDLDAYRPHLTKPVLLPGTVDQET